MATYGRRRALGQHFLADKAVARRIADEAVTQAVNHGCHSLLEIGPGKGAITEPLLELLSDRQDIGFFLAERDPKLVEFWREKPQPPRIEAGDFLDLPESRWLAHTPLAVASNLPYSAGTAILTRLAAQHRKIPVMVLMFQLEVAQRLRAEPGSPDSKNVGSLSVWIQNRWNVRKLVHVPPKAFRPPPEVDSEVVVLERRDEPRVPVWEDEASEMRWQQLLRVAFAHRRKMLRSGLPSGPWRNALERSGVDGTKRAEALGWDEWNRLYQALS